MDEREKRFKNTLGKAYPLLDSFEKGYMLGLLEGKVREKEKELQKKNERQLSKT